MLPGRTLRRTLRRCLAVGFKGTKGSQKGFLEGFFQKGLLEGRIHALRRVRPLGCAPGAP